ncbi:DNA mismatch repair protein MutT [Rhizobium sp. Root268]|nr:DNA mismatch repair protein MutT [Rhizobium sp. Root1212]KRD31206.1 DNA mismatch repair protein MutT [Rhizobium sp. Root268]
MSLTDFSATDFRRRAMQQQGSHAEDAWREHGDFLLNPDIASFVETLKLRDAAVLVPVIDDGEDARVLLTQRTTTLRKHSGQVAFPGGAIDPGDDTPERAALRETEEEIGLDRRFVQPVGRLPTYMAMSGFRITPVLAVVEPGFELTLNPVEVDSVFEVPLSFLMNPHNHGRGRATWQGSERQFYRMPYGERNIWGITAGIIRMLYERLYA